MWVRKGLCTRWWSWAGYWMPAVSLKKMTCFSPNQLDGHSARDRTLKLIASYCAHEAEQRSLAISSCVAYLKTAGWPPFLLRSK
jgi:hypothetical protein